MLSEDLLRNIFVDIVDDLRAGQPLEEDANQEKLRVVNVIHVGALPERHPERSQCESEHPRKPIPRAAKRKNRDSIDRFVTRMSRYQGDVIPRS